MVKRRSCDDNDIHHIGHDHIQCRHVGNQSMYLDYHIHKIGEK